MQETLTKQKKEAKKAASRQMPPAAKARRNKPQAKCAGATCKLASWKINQG
jgi:hypothetical protein